jgi:hypothetical protein
MTHPRFVLRCGAGLLFAATAACSLTVGFDGFVGSDARDGGGLDGNTASTDPTPGEEGGTGSTSNDAGTDAARPDPNVPPVFVDGGSYCSTGGEGATFCEDFDTADLPARWITEGVFAKLTSYAPKSEPNVLLVDVPPSNAGGTFVSKVTRAFDVPSTNMVLAFDIKPERVNAGASFFILGALEWTRADDKYSLRLVYSNGRVRLEESNLIAPPNNKDTYHPFFDLPTDKWTRVSLDIVGSGGSPGVQLSLDGVAVGVREPLAPTPNISQRPTLILGAVYAGNPHTGWSLRYDDVTLTFR